MVHPVVQQIANEYKQQLIQLYGSGLDSLILFGSYARGHFRNESDIDFAIILKNPQTRISTKFSKRYPSLLHWD